jgi:actin-like ATPase involved in cell morphogenesis
MPTLYAVDCGFGETKLWTMRNHTGLDDPRHFPSIIAKTHANKIGPYGQHPLYIDNQPWAYGQDARYLPQAMMPAAHERLADPAVQALIASALWEMGAEGSIALATGIPLGRFDTERQAALHALQHRTWHLRRDHHSRTVTIDRVFLYPQGLAALIASHPAAQKAGRWPQHGLAALVDIGYRTMDIAILDVDSQQALPDLSKSFDVGIGDLVAQVTAAIEDQYHELMTPAVALDLLTTHELSLYGKTVDVTDLVTRHQVEWGQQLANLLIQWWRDRLKDIRLLVTIGGGSQIFNAALAPTFSGCWSPLYPLFANVRGYFILSAAQQEDSQWSAV